MRSSILIHFLGGLRLITDNFVSTVAPTEISRHSINKKHLLEGGDGENNNGNNGNNNGNNGDDSDSDNGIIVAPRCSSWAEGKVDKVVSTLTRKEAQAFARKLASSGIGGSGTKNNKKGKIK